MLIRVMTYSGKTVDIDIDPDDTIFRIKERVEVLEGIPPQQQRLIFCGKQLNDEKTILEANIIGGSTLHLVLALRGGNRSEDEVKCRSADYVRLQNRLLIVELFSAENQPLLLRWNALQHLDTLLDSKYRVIRINIDVHCFAAIGHHAN
ncbi:unnamed protein product [Nesidiocoris tenuis]|uniref:Ubiquitin-like domain-containing protein n=1 Tax=Nesidiocoris tenuis TaxID=355587 RepID=A0A6H5GZT4_9HEMI|nr:unnamed protein product [Nesidiocoris tenuis]